MHKFDQLFYLLMEDITSNFNEKFCYIIGKSKLIQPNDETLQCIYIDKHLLSSINKRTFNGDIDYSISKIEKKINKFICKTINEESNYIKKFSLDKSKIEANFGIPYICECKKSNLKIKIFIKYDKTFNRFYGFAKTCWHSFHPHKISKFHPNEQIRSLENESINN